jgi:flagellar biosynthesis protein FlhF
MQISKFYGQTIRGTLSRVKREFGADALILETRTIDSGDAASRMHPGAKIEICAVREIEEVQQPTNSTEGDAIAVVGDGQPSQPIRFPQVGSNLLEDLGLLKKQIRQLLQGEGLDEGQPSARVDLEDYHGLIEQGVDHEVLAPHLRRWLQWRTATPPLRRYLAEHYQGPATRIQGDSLREWLCLAWSELQGLNDEPSTTDHPGAPGPQVVAVVGQTGVGKTTTLAKLASISRQEKRQNSVILTLDTRRVGATEQWRQLGRLMNIPVEEISNDADLGRSMEKWDRWDWIGIDTPGGMSGHCEAQRHLGSILARYPRMNNLLVLPATHPDALNKELMERAQGFGTNRVMFSKLDETPRRGGIVNLTLDGRWKVDGFSMGSRVPEDWAPASRESFWDQVLTPPAHNRGQIGAAS